MCMYVYTYTYIYIYTCIIDIHNNKDLAAEPGADGVGVDAALGDDLRLLLYVYVYVYTYMYI